MKIEKRVENGRVALHCFAPNRKNSTRTCGTFLGEVPAPVGIEWVGCLTRTEYDQYPELIVLYCRTCKHHNLFALTATEN